MIETCDIQIIKHPSNQSFHHVTILFKKGFEILQTLTLVKISSNSFSIGGIVPKTLEKIYLSTLLTIFGVFGVWVQIDNYTEHMIPTINAIDEFVFSFFHFFHCFFHHHPIYWLKKVVVPGLKGVKAWEEEVSNVEKGDV